MTIISFGLAWLLHKKVRCWKLPLLLAPFATFSCLLVTLFGDNVQYLSFRSFQQLRFMVPRSPVETMSIILAILTLFLVVVSGSALYLLIWSFDQKRFRTETMKHRFNSFVLLTINLGGRIVAGFLHAYIDIDRYRMFGMIVINMSMLVITAQYYLVYKVKRSLAVYLYNLIVKLLVSIILAIEIELSFSIGSSPSLEEESFGNVITLLVYSLTVFYILHYLLTTFWSFCDELFTTIKLECQKPLKRKKKIIKTKKPADAVTQDKHSHLNKGEHLRPPPLKTIKIKEVIQDEVRKMKLFQSKSEIGRNVANDDM